MSAAGLAAQTMLNDRLAVTALALHGPVDIFLTSLGRRICPGDPEGNPLVHILGEEKWLLVKTAMIGGTAVAWWIGRSHALMAIPLGILVLLGLIFVVPNAAVVGGCVNLDGLGAVATRAIEAR